MIGDPAEVGPDELAQARRTGGQRKPGEIDATVLAKPHIARPREIEEARAALEGRRHVEQISVPLAEVVDASSEPQPAASAPTRPTSIDNAATARRFRAATVTVTSLVVFTRSSACARLCPGPGQPINRHRRNEARPSIRARRAVMLLGSIRASPERTRTNDLPETCGRARGGYRSRSPSPRRAGVLVAIAACLAVTLAARSASADALAPLALGNGERLLVVAPIHDRRSPPQG
ncbi:MAG: hypothetical protein U0610_29435 [bacterium]